MSSFISTTTERWRAQEAFLWLIPIGVGMTYFVVSEKVALELIAACLAALLFVFFVNRPGGTLIALLIFLPLENIVFGLLYSWHIPGAFLRQASGIKELMALAILISGLRVLRDSGDRLDRIDIAVLLYVAVVTIYLIAPHIFSAIAPTQWAPRLLAWRSDAGYPLLFMGARHAPITQKVKDKILQLVLLLGAFDVVVGFYQKIDPTGFSNFVIKTAHVAIYDNIVLGTPVNVVTRNLAYLYVLNPLHIGSVLFSPYDFADFMVIVAAITAVRISHHHRSLFNYALFAGAMANLFFTQVRADALAIVIVLVFIALPASRSPVEGRLRLIATLAIAAVLVVPSLSHTRYFGNAAAAKSSTGHIQEFANGVGIIQLYPLGLGLGQQPGVANKYTNLTHVANGGDFSDNMITQVGDELGLQALIPWLVMMIFIGLELKRRAARGDDFAACLGFAFLGIVIAGEYHHVFLTFAVPWTLWAGVGLALSVDHSNNPQDSELEANSYPSTSGVR